MLVKPRIIPQKVINVKDELRSLNVANMCVTLLSATGEPPLCMSCSVFFALRKCIEEARKDAGHTGYFDFCKDVFSTVFCQRLNEMSNFGY